MSITAQGRHKKTDDREMAMTEIRGEKSEKIRGESLAVYHSKAFSNSRSNKCQLIIEFAGNIII